LSSKVELRAEELTVRYTQWLLRWRWPIIITVLLASAVTCYGFRYFVLDNDYRVFFSHDDPKLLDYEALQNAYTKDETLFFIVTSKSGEVFDRETLAALGELTESAWQLPHVLRVDSVTNFQYVSSEGDELRVQPLVSNPAEMSDEELARAKETALNEPLLLNRLVKPGSPVTGVNLTVHIPEDGKNRGAELTAAAEELASEIVAAHPGVEIALTGLIPLNNAFYQATLHDLTTLVPVMLVVLMFMMVVMLQSAWLMGAVSLIVLLSTATSVGIVSWMGYHISGPVTPAPLIILTLAVADCVHIIMTMQHYMREGMDRRAAILESMRINMNAVFLTSFTTVIGFLSMNFNSAPPIQLMGNTVSLGVVIAWFLAVVLLPPLLAVLPFRVKPSSRDERMQRAMAVMAGWVIRWKTPLVVFLAAVGITFGAFVPSIHINNQFAEWFEEDYPIRKNTQYLMENLTGIYQVAFSLKAGESDGVSDPEYLQNVDRFANWLRAQEGVVQVGTVVDTLKRVNRSMNGDDPAMYRLPESRELAAQYLLLYEMSLPMGIDLNTEINVDKSATRLIVTTANLPSEQMAVLIDRAQDWQRANLPAGMYSDAIGPSVMFCEISRSMIRSMMVSAPFSLVLVILALMLSLRSVRMGILAIFPNMAPMAVGLGLWGMMGWDMDFSMTTIISMTIGIIVDNTIHFMSKYLRARKEAGLSARQSVRYAYSCVGVPLWTNAVVLVSGFGVLTLSPMMFCDNMGVLSTVVMVSSLIANLVMLPGMLLLADGGGGKDDAEEKETADEKMVIVAEA